MTHQPLTPSQAKHLSKACIQVANYALACGCEVTAKLVMLLLEEANKDG